MMMIEKLFLIKRGFIEFVIKHPVIGLLSYFSFFLVIVLLSSTIIVWLSGAAKLDLTFLVPLAIGFTIAFYPSDIDTD